MAAALALCACSQPRESAILQDFSLGGRPVPPAQIQRVFTNLAGKEPDTLEVDVAPAETERDQAGWIYDAGMTPGRVSEWVRYKVAGVAGRGVQVLRVQECGGGSGVFEDLLFVVLRERDGRHSLKRLGQEVLGDRRFPDLQVGLDFVQASYRDGEVRRFRIPSD